VQSFANCRQRCQGTSVGGRSAFRRARAGFGARSRWLWQLPRHREDQEQDTAPQPRLPIDWVEGVDSLDPDRPPDAVPRHRWRQFVEDCKTFLNSPDSLAGRAARLGWDAKALFGCAPNLRSENRCRKWAKLLARRDLPLSEGNFRQTISKSGYSVRSCELITVPWPTQPAAVRCSGQGQARGAVP
jgi:hypothetical protein